MVVLYCPCPERHRLWGELWWVGEEHRWIFFDDLQNSETYTEQVEYCPACAMRLTIITIPTFLYRSGNSDDVR
jgi:hypothetical protein